MTVDMATTANRAGLVHKSGSKDMSQPSAEFLGRLHFILWHSLASQLGVLGNAKYEKFGQQDMNNKFKFNDPQWKITFTCYNYISFFHCMQHDKDNEFKNAM
jgi:hypothetical protein